MNSHFLRYLCWSAVVVVLDQLTKVFTLRTFPDEGLGFAVTSFFNFVRVHNHGAAFSFLSDAGGWQRWFFTVLAIAVSALLVWMLKKGEGSKLFLFAISSVLGGAIGNVIDRIWHGYVIDFLDFHWNFLSPIFYKGHFPAFNLADSAITLGAILLITDEVLRMLKRPKPSN